MNNIFTKKGFFILLSSFFGLTILSMENKKNNLLMENKKNNLLMENKKNNLLIELLNKYNLGQKEFKKESKGYFLDPVSGNNLCHVNSLLFISLFKSNKKNLSDLESTFLESSFILTEFKETEYHPSLEKEKIIISLKPNPLKQNNFLYGLDKLSKTKKTHFLKELMQLNSNTMIDLLREYKIIKFDEPTMITLGGIRTLRFFDEITRESFDYFIPLIDFVKVKINQFKKMPDGFLNFMNIQKDIFLNPSVEKKEISEFYGINVELNIINFKDPSVSKKFNTFFELIDFIKKASQNHNQLLLENEKDKKVLNIFDMFPEKKEKGINIFEKDLITGFLLTKEGHNVGFRIMDKEQESMLKDEPYIISIDHIFFKRKDDIKLIKGV